jgi:hypothetical protein
VLKFYINPTDKSVEGIPFVIAGFDGGLTLVAEQRQDATTEEEPLR